ncbi:MAG: MerR family transcriptional regulator [Acidobacteriota bacterium]|nr:MerR family transcriptional regulator [Acidobacteriota bacterium]
MSPSTLRGWERRFGFPAPRRSEGGHRQFELADVESLRSAMAQTGDVASAVAIARERGAGPPSHAQLEAALASYDAVRADGLLEASLALRSVERSVEEVLLPAVAGLEDERAGGGGARGDGHAGPGGSRTAAPPPEYCFAWRYATGWLCAAQRVAPPASRPEGVLIFDAAAPLDGDALHAQALELMLRRASLRVLSLPTDLDPPRLGNALLALRPSAVVLSGTRAPLDLIARLIYVTRQCVGEVEVLDFRGAVPDTGASTVGRLGRSPMEALAGITERLAAGRPERTAALPGAMRGPAPSRPARSARFKRGGDAGAVAGAQAGTQTRDASGAGVTVAG